MAMTADEHYQEADRLLEDRCAGYTGGTAADATACALLAIRHSLQAQAGATLGKHAESFG